MAQYQSKERLTEHVRVMLAPSMRQWLEAEALRQGRSFGQIVREALRKEMHSHSEARLLTAEEAQSIGREIMLHSHS